MTICDESKNLNMFNFTTGTILGKDFAQAQVHVGSQFFWVLQLKKVIHNEILVCVYK